MEIKNIVGDVLFALDSAKTIAELVTAAVKARADLRDADLSGAVLRVGTIHTMRVFTGLCRYQVWAVLFEDGSRWVRMGCLFKSLDEWERIGIRNSNPGEFPDDGSDASEERAAAFEFAKAMALRMKAPNQAEVR